VVSRERLEDDRDAASKWDGERDLLGLHNTWRDLGVDGAGLGVRFLHDLWADEARWKREVSLTFRR